MTLHPGLDNTMKMYPIIAAVSASETSPAVDQSFRLTRISELDAFLRKEVEDRRKILKKYQRAINITQNIADGAGVVFLGGEAVGISLIATGVLTLPGFILTGLGAGSFFITLVCDRIRRRCTTKAEKHMRIAQTALSKLNSVHQLVSKALADSKVSDEEFKTISDELDRYQSMKEEIRSKAQKVDNATKKELLERGREEVRAEFAKYISGVPQK